MGGLVPAAGTMEQRRGVVSVCSSRTRLAAGGDRVVGGTGEAGEWRGGSGPACVAAGGWREVLGYQI